MNYRIIKKIILGIIITGMFGVFAEPAFAVAPLSVQFQNNPLFSEANFLPGNEVIRTVGVTNNSDATQSVIVEAINAVDEGGLGNKLHLVIKNGDTIIYNNTLGTFLRAGEVSLSTLIAGNTNNYSFGVTFESSANNDTQEAVIGFDLCVGFSGGDRRCGNTVIGDEGDTGGGGGVGGDGGGGTTITGTGGGGGGGNGPIVPTALIIFNEQANNIISTGELSSATITWDTNKLATTQVVYGLASGGPYALDLNVINFGYPFGTIEDGTKVIFHTVHLQNLIAGQTYVYRVISRASPATVSFEHQFTIPIPTQGGNNTFAVNPNNGVGGNAVLGQGNNNINNNDADGLVANEEVSSTTKELVGSVNRNLASVFSSGFGGILSLCSLFAILVLFTLYLIWRYWLRVRYEKRGLTEDQIKNKFYIFFGSTSLLAIIILIVISYTCPVPVFLISLIICLAMYFYRNFWRNTNNKVR